MRRHLGIVMVVGLVAALTVACTPPTEPDNCPTATPGATPALQAAAARSAVADGPSTTGSPPPLDRVVRPQTASLADRPDLARAVASPTAQRDISANELSFTYNSPTYPWSAAELQQLQQVVATSYPIIKQVIGPPLFPITVNFRKDPTLPSTVAGQFWASNNEIVIRVLDPGTFVHELIHAFRDDLVMWDDAFEEGMTRAAEVEVMGRMPASYLTDYFDRAHSYPDDVNYEMFNDTPAVGAPGGEFWTDRDPALTFLRYQLSGYAWAKAYLEDPQFFVRFDAALYQASLTNPSVTSDEGALVRLAAAALPTVETLPFDQWYHAQRVFDTSPPTGELLLFRYIPPYALTVHALRRAADGTEVPLTGRSVPWSAVDVAGAQIGAGTATTGSDGSTSLPLSVPSGYTGRIGLSATTGSGAQAVTTKVNASWTQGSGVYGTVPRSNGGYVEVRNLGTAGRVCATLAAGAFDVANLGPVRGRFSATVHYDDGVTVTRSFNKDAAPYFVPFRVGPNG